MDGATDLTSGRQLIPISELKPDIAPSGPQAIRAIATLIWPYSASQRKIGIVLAEPDFRLRRRKGQVRIEVFGSLATTLNESEISSGDEVILCLEGATYVKSATAVGTPGRGIDWDIRFTSRLLLQIKKEAQPPKTLDLITAEPPTVSDERSFLESFDDSPASSPLKAPSFRQRIDPLREWKTPAFLKHSSSQSGLSFTASQEADREEDGYLEGSGRKRTKFGRKSGEWRYTKVTPSPEPEAAEDENEDVSQSGASKTAQPEENRLLEPYEHNVEDKASVVQPDPESHPEIERLPRSDGDEVTELHQSRSRVVSSEENSAPLAHPPLTIATSEIEIPSQRPGADTKSPPLNSATSFLELTKSPQIMPVTSPTLPEISPLLMRRPTQPGPSFPTEDSLTFHGSRLGQANFGHIGFGEASSLPLNDFGIDQSPNASAAPVSSLIDVSQSFTSIPDPMQPPFAIFSDQTEHRMPKTEEDNEHFAFHIPSSNGLESLDETSQADSSSAQGPINGMLAVGGQPSYWQFSNQESIAEDSTAPHNIAGEASYDEYGAPSESHDPPAADLAPLKQIEPIVIDSDSDEELNDVSVVDRNEQNLSDDQDRVDEEEEEEEDGEEEKEDEEGHEEGDLQKILKEEERDERVSGETQEDVRRNNLSVALIDDTLSNEEAHSADEEGVLSSSPKSPQNYTSSLSEHSLSPREGRVSSPPRKRTPSPRTSSPQLFTPDDTQEREPATSDPASFEHPAMSDEKDDSSEDSRGGELFAPSIAHPITPADSQMHEEPHGTSRNVGEASPSSPHPPQESGFIKVHDQIATPMGEATQSPMSEQILERSFDRINSIEEEDKIVVVSTLHLSDKHQQPSSLDRTETQDPGSPIESIENYTGPKKLRQHVVKNLLASEEQRSASSTAIVLQHDIPRSELSVDEKAPEPAMAAARTGFDTAYSHFTPLAYLNSHFQETIDTVAVIASTNPASRAKKGQKNWFLLLDVTSPSLALIAGERKTVRVEIYRVHKEALPPTAVGDAVLLRNFQVRSRNHKLVLNSTVTSGYVVFPNKSPNEVVKGPPVEYGEEEKTVARGLIIWWRISQKDKTRNQKGDPLQEVDSRPTLPSEPHSDPSSNKENEKREVKKTAKRKKAQSSKEVRSNDEKGQPATAQRDRVLTRSAAAALKDG